MEPLKRKKTALKVRSLAEVNENTRLRMAEESVQGISRRRRWIFRLVALWLPLVFLGLLELGLRLVGFGYPTSYFLKEKAAGRMVYVANPGFTRRFFPPGLARTPLPAVLPMDKAPETVRVFIFGESAAMGDPAPAYGFGRILEVLLRSRFPHRKFEVANVATTAINSHVVRDIARDCVSKEGDIWIVYMGNNEVVGPYGAGTVFSEQTPGLAVIRAQLALKTTRLGQWLDIMRSRLSKTAGEPKTWEGMEMFLERQVRLHDPAMDRVYAHFERNLGEVVDLGLQAGAQVLVSTVVCNLKDCAPFASLPATDWSAERKSAWDQLCQEGAELQAKGRPGEALAVLQKAERLEAGPAELHFRLGESYLALDDFPEAKRAFEHARDLDTLRFRVDTRLNHLIRQVTVQRGSDLVKLVDAEEIFARQYPHRIAGQEFLYEHVHLNFEGNYLLARAMLEQLAPWLRATDPAPDRAAATWLSPAECGARLALTDWDQAQIVDEVVKRLTQPPFIHQLGHQEREQRWQETLGQWQGRLTATNLEAGVGMYRQALALAPEDWILHEQFAKFLEELHRLEEAIQQWTWVLDHVPRHPEALYHLGNNLDKLGRSNLAIPRFREALRRCPEMDEARNGLALALANTGQTNEAIRLLAETVRRKPAFTEARVNLGQILARQGHLAEAQAQYETALRYRSNSPAAHINLGQVFLRQGKPDQAELHYREGMRLAPDSAIAHFNLANLLADRNSPEAAAHYEAAVRLDPNLAEARVNWGLVLAERGQIAAALEQFREAVRLQPGLGVARLNLGVALARQGRLEEAIPQFEETLRLDPSNSSAQQFLDQAQAMLRQKSAPR